MKKWLIGAVLLSGAAYMAYDAYLYSQAGGFSLPELKEGEFPVSFKSGFRGVMSGLEDRRSERRYLGYPARDVPVWYSETWSTCRPMTGEERRGFEQNVVVGPGGRAEAICEIDADGDVFVRGWVASVPEL